MLSIFVLTCYGCINNNKTSPATDSMNNVIATDNANIEVLNTSTVYPVTLLYNYDKTKSVKLFYTVIIGNGDNKTFSTSANIALFSELIITENGKFTKIIPSTPFIGNVVSKNIKDYDYLDYSLTPEGMTYEEYCKANSKINQPFPVFSWVHEPQRRINFSKKVIDALQAGEVVPVNIILGSGLGYSGNFTQTFYDNRGCGGGERPSVFELKIRKIKNKQLKD